MPPNQAPDNGPDSLYFTAPEDRRALRRRLLALRAALPDRETADAQIAAALAPLLERLGVQRLGFYWPIQQEFDARDTVARWLAAMPGRVAALPVVSRAAAPLDFHAWTPDTTMRVGQYGIPVPDGTGAVTPDALLIPCVGFSANKFRLGYGGGFYDRTLAAMAAANATPIAIGIGFAACEAPLQAASHDLPMDWLVTELGAR
ncbi:5-formyltetrahydrofolate cyclo-ligase [Cupriavidus metallidurans]|jgi:5-formyltetrahydrofolate cyclo-ligase|nr:5-formyltetrahydrofolate cyclo-ligase [Cupriavidus metallidurans]AVA32285.1 5-formyltetrahydrofolate cyclo-ligase [Cupriavidus metallidurans]MDE4916484.1 5-formyltetrahydrofolate cyclo-ligase [Cupriavidus metallidurans]QGS28587.1 5-formyltetrahydrofolate cyclo-ligase [Cupriavidus metallidurans]